MANLDFYALADDHRALIEFLFAETDVVIYEVASEFDRELRQFRSFGDLEAAFPIGAYRAAQLQLWSPSVMAHPIIRRTELTASSSRQFRYSVEGAGLIQLYLSGIQDDVIHHSHFGHWSEAGARQRCIHPADDCDWSALNQLSGRIQRHIRGRLAATKLQSRPVLHDALAAVQHEGVGLWVGPAVHRADSAEIRSKVA